MWPAVVVSESNFGPKKALKPSRTNESILVQFFGTHDFARLSSYLRAVVFYIISPKPFSLLFKKNLVWILKIVLLSETNMRLWICYYEL